jgi:hypothetical protein
MPRPKARYPKNTVITFRVSALMSEQLRAIEERDGIPVAEQIRRALRPWIEKERVMEAGRKRAVTRRRS